MEKREIRFRAWIPIFNKMAEPGSFEIDVALANPEKYELMQYTGLKDKNGVEIYEGDIIQGGVRLMEVKFKQEACQFWLVWKDAKIHRYEPLTANYGDSDCFVNDALEVIGNIYENENLIKS